jgi:hypothetical protein
MTSNDCQSITLLACGIDDEILLVYYTNTPVHVFLFRSSYKEVHVSLADLNDHPPVFDKEEYEIRVPESALVNTPLTRLKVRDASISYYQCCDLYPGKEFFRPGSWI